MQKGLSETLIVSLTDILMGNQVNPEAVSKSLELICRDTSFDCGLVYELNQLEQFCLMSKYTVGAALIPECFDANECTSEEQAFLAQKEIYYMKRNQKNTPLEAQIMDMFAASALIFATVIDESSHIYGLVALISTDVKESISEREIKTLSALLSILVRYVGMSMYQHKLVQAQTSLENILDNTGIDIYVNDFNNHDILYVNKSMAAPYGGREVFMGQKCWKALFPGQTGPCEFCPQNNLIDEDGVPTKVYTWDYQRPFDGSWFRVFSAAFPWTDGRLAHVVSSADITDNKKNEALVEYLANYDQLTKLPNRRMLLKESERRIENATETEQGYLLFFDIDGFKAINDNFGHDAGDEFLIKLGEFFSSIPMLKDSIYRNGGDEFVAVIGGEAISKDNIKSLGGFIHGRFRAPWNLKKGQVFCNTSIGVACFPEDGRTPEVLLQKADAAMYMAKKSGGGKICFGYQLKA